MRSRAFAGVAIILAAAPASAQVSGLNKGQLWFLKNGIQVQGMASDPLVMGDPFHLATYQGLNYSAVNWLWHSDVAQLGPAPGSMPWARWVGPGASPPGTADMPPVGSEAPYMSNLIALSLGDEPNLNDATVRDTYVNWFNTVAPSYPNQLLYMNNYGGQVTDGPLGDFVSRAHPDMLSFDTYPYRYVAPNNPVPVQPAGGSPTNWYGDLRRYREHTRTTSTPLGMYRQTYHSTSEGVRDVSESELRLMTYAGLAFNAKYLTDFTYNTGASSFFNNAMGGDNSPNALYPLAAQINLEVRNLGPAMVRLKPVNDPTIPSGWTSSIMFVRGKNDPGTGAVYNNIPIGFIQDGASPAYTDWTFAQNDPYLSGGFPSGATNLGTRNGGLPGDVIVSWFTPSDEWFDGDDWNNEKYIMVVNGLADMNGSAADCRQTITLDFSMGASGITMLQKINRATGAVEDVPMTLVSGKRRLVLTLDGGTGELFKFKDGAPFVGTLPNDAIWTSSGNGAFETGGNWDIASAPGAGNFIHFGATTSGSGPGYNVTFANNTSVKGAFVHRDDVALNLNGKTLSITGFSGVDSLIVGMKSGETGSLTITNGALSVAASTGYFSEIGKAAGASGVVTVGSGGNFSSNPDLLIGKAGVGTLNVSTGGNGSFTNVTLGGTTGASAGVLNVNGGVTVTGTLKLNDTGGAAPAGTRVNLSSGSLTVGSLLTSSNSARFNWTGGALSITSSNLNVSTSGALGANLAISGTKNLNVSATLSINSGGVITETGGAISAGTIALTTGSTFIRTGGTLAFTNFFQTGGTSSLGAVSGPGSITIGGGAGATQMAADNVVANALTINNLGTMIVTAGNGAAASKVNTLTIAGGASSAGTLNLNDNSIVIDYAGASPIATIASQIASGYAGGAWTGPGVNSTIASIIAGNPGDTHKTAIGFAEAGSVFASFPATFQNQSVSTTLLIRYTYTGDANLSGGVDSIDFNLLAANFGQTDKRWSDGDFNFDGMVDSIDFNQLASNFGQLITPAQAGTPTGALIPEPSAASIVLTLLIPAIARRRRRIA